MALDDDLRAHDTGITAVVKEFTDEVDRIFLLAQGRTIARIYEGLVFAAGEITRSSGNQKVLRRVNKILIEELDRAGYYAAVNGFTGSFTGQLEWFERILNEMFATMKVPPPEITWSATDLRTLSAQALNYQVQLDAEVERIAASYRRQILFSAAALDRKALVEMLSATMSRGSGEVAAMADTAVPTFYRTIAKRGFEKIEEDTPLKYGYFGPLDKLNRPFCRARRRETLAGKNWTMKEIEAMNNGTSLPVETTCGGWRCRHQWVVVAIELPEGG